MPDRVIGVMVSSPMRRFLPILACVATSAAQTAPPATEDAPAPPTSELRPKTVSKSRQVVVHGSDFVTRGAVATLAEEVREKLGKELGRDDGWKHSITIQLHGVQGDPVPPRTLRSQFFQVPGGFRLQLDVHLAKGKPAELERTLLELLLIERGLRDWGEESLEGSLGIPPWLLDGFLESFRWREGERDRDLYATLFEKNQLFPVRRLLDTKEPGAMDSMTRAAFRASSGALVMALLGQEGGAQAMNALLGDLATFEGDAMALLMKHFPGMNLGKESFSKWWALQLARMSETPFLQVLPILDTERELEELLVVRFRDEAGGQFEVRPGEFRDLLALPREQREQALRPLVEKLGVFLYRAFPAHRELIVEYLSLLGEIANDRDNDIELRVADLAVRRAELVALGERTRDYLEWYRITNAKQLSGDFDSFIKLKEELNVAPRQRSGPVSRYLDDMQRVLGEP